MTSLNKSHARLNAGFTLIELLVVISIILIASSIIFIGGNGGDGAKLTSAQRIVSSIAQGARGQAILKNAKTRLIIYTDTTPNNQDPDKFLRYIGIVYQDSVDPTKWNAATQGTSLPEGIYFNPTLSSSNNWTESKMNINYPRQSAQSGSSGDEYYYYEFSSNGTMAPGFDNNAWLVLQAGQMGQDLLVDFSAEDKAGLKSAIIFRRVGTTTMVSAPEDIN
jgi:prepilin-type N-terminal cleavage/methylation domain-containing protein